MGVRGFRRVVLSVSIVLKRPALLALERQSLEMRSFSPPKTTSVGRLFEGETKALSWRGHCIRLSRRTSSMKKGQPSNCQEVHQRLFVIAIELFLALRQSKKSWQLDFWARKCLKVWFESWSTLRRDRQSWESVQESTQIYKKEWRVFRRSVKESIICGVQNLRRVRLHVHQRISCSCSVDGQFNELWSGLFLLYAGVISTCTSLMWVLDYIN